MTPTEKYPLSDISASARFERAFVYYTDACWDAALSELDLLIADSPSHPNAAYLRAGLLRRLHGDLDSRVLDAYALVLEVDPDNAYAQVERADVLRSLGRHHEARDVFARYSLGEPCDDENLYVESAFKLGCVSLVLQDIPTAVTAFQSVLALSPDYPDAAEMLALAQNG